jgi:hypothetical protein
MIKVKKPRLTNVKCPSQVYILGDGRVLESPEFLNLLVVYPLVFYCTILP